MLISFIINLRNDADKIIGALDSLVKSVQYSCMVIKVSYKSLDKSILYVFGVMIQCAINVLKNQ